MNRSCEFEWPYHHGKVEWHHPISYDETVGVWLCELHHSLVQGRKKLNMMEINEKYTLDQIRRKVVRLVISKVQAAGYSKYDIDKN